MHLWFYKNIYMKENTNSLIRDLKSVDQINFYTGNCFTKNLSSAVRAILLWEEKKLNLKPEECYHIYPTPPLGQDMTQG